METKDELIMNVKEWIKIDSEITKLQNELRDRKNKKKQLSELLMIVMKKNEIECFDINGGSLIYKQNKVKKAINAKMLIATLHTYFASTNIKAEEVTKFILDNREEQIKEMIKRKIDK